VRIVVFTANPGLDRSVWWSIVQDTPGLTHVLVCRKVFSPHPRDVWRRFRRNVRKHGLIFIPFRTGLLAGTLVRRLVSRPAPAPPVAASAPCEEIEALDLNAPDVVARVAAWGADLGLSLGAPVLRRPLFGLPRLGTINLHLGKVPDYRGAPPGFWELWTDADEIGATIHMVDDGLDTGPVLEQLVAPLYRDDTPSVALARAEELGRIALARVLERASRGDVAAAAQPGGGRTFRFPTVTQHLRLALRVAARRAARRWGRPSYGPKVIGTFLALYVLRPVRDLWWSLRRRHPVRVFNFHRVTFLCRDGMTVPPPVCHRQVEYVRRTHDVVSLERALELLGSGARLRRPAAVLTFDDGYRSVYDAARPAFASLGVAGCCFLSTDLVSTDRRFGHDADSPVRQHLGVMTWGEVAELRAAGWSFGAHGATHARLSACDADALRYELEAPLAALRSRLGLERVSLAYPFGGRADITPEALALARARGYTACLSDFGGQNTPPADPFALRRIELGGDHDTLMWKARVCGIDFGAWRDERAWRAAQSRRGNSSA